MNVSEAILRELVESGVEACFANPGTSEMHLVASFDRVGPSPPVGRYFTRRKGPSAAARA
jgi:thiamine pyrophosphate-dependent acetolactate synthase large subunit-like protein